MTDWNADEPLALNRNHALQHLDAIERAVQQAREVLAQVPNEVLTDMGDYFAATDQAYWDLQGATGLLAARDAGLAQGEDR